ncbi:hypothetical protein FA95DRAFT_880618 [Auriscalpium vulgare]|uniref:Uncharacterized protein n=1 Tax=Auriscalpium vulgare TaxID=40419 RepID=A0ACB8S0C0_9AGAM|nr:hypothetical protein FA95DRAFT_880618 [Auriscalpium vulgare]
MDTANSSSPSTNEFDALLDLLATDDNEDLLVQPSSVGDLRDADGRLDFTKIRSLFQVAKTSVVTYSPQAATETGQYSFLTLAKRDITPLPHERGSQPQSLEDLPPGSGQELRPEDFIGGSIYSPVGAEGITQGPRSSGRGEFDDIPQDHRDHLLYDLDRALTQANGELADLRKRCIELQSQSADFSVAKACQPDTIHDPQTLEDPTFQGIIERLNLSLNSGASINRIQAFSDVERAVGFLMTMDELVWRRSEYPSNAPSAMFSERNVRDLVERTALWESIVRGPVPPP